MIKYGGRGFLGQWKNWLTGAKAAVAERGIKQVLWEQARAKEMGYLNASAQNCVGTDEFGNRYFEDTSGGKLRGRDRWVEYNSPGNSRVFDYPPQTSSIPPTWHAWMHQIDDRPAPSGEALDPCTKNFIVAGSEVATTYDHVKPWRENPTGKGHEVEYRQSGHWQAGNYRIQTYESWDGTVKKTLPPPNSNN